MISDLYEKAIEFAAKAHQGQMRKGQDVPYIVHPFTVSAILKEQNCDEHVIIAGLLHDTVEDTAVSLESLRFDFGDQIADLVAICTEPDKGLPWEERKQHMLNVMRTAPFEAKFVFCADKLHNIRSMIAAHKKFGDEVWRKFSRGYEKQKWYAQSVIKSLFHNLDVKHQKPMFFELDRTIQEFFEND